MPSEEEFSSPIIAALRSPPTAGSLPLLPCPPARPREQAAEHEGKSKTSAITLKGAGIGYCTRYTITSRTLIIFCTSRALSMTVRYCSLNMAMSRLTKTQHAEQVEPHERRGDEGARRRARHLARVIVAKGRPERCPEGARRGEVELGGRKGAERARAVLRLKVRHEEVEGDTRAKRDGEDERQPVEELAAHAHRAHNERAGLVHGKTSSSWAAMVKAASASGRSTSLTRSSRQCRQLLRAPLRQAAAPFAPSPPPRARRPRYAVPQRPGRERVPVVDQIGGDRRAA